MVEYKIIHGSNERDVEDEINKLAKDGYKVEKFNTTPYGSFMSGAVYVHVLMIKD